MRKIIHLSVISVSALLLLLITIVFTACNSSSGDNVIAESKDGVHFFTGTLEAASALSKKENKPIFLLAHASYCSSCKKMKRSIFPLKEVGEVFNKNFINVQVDIESEEGIKVVKDYEITGTPTLLFLTPDGQVINKASGYQSQQELLALTRGMKVEGKPVYE